MATEKSKSEQSLSVESRLKSLYELQTILSKIDRIRQVRGELPLEVSDLEDNITGLKTRIQNHQADIQELLHKNATEEENMRESESKIAKYN